MTDSFFQDHWLHIEDERLERYEKMFTWRPEQKVLLEPAEIKVGHQVMDFGSGPGYLALELASWVGETGFIWGMDINQEFVRRSNERAQASGANASFQLVRDGKLPLRDDFLDRAISKNVLEYVPDLKATLDEIYRVIKPGGKLHAVDSDWGFVIVEPWGKHRVDEFFAAASAAFKEPHIGRKLAAALLESGFKDIKVSIRPSVDRKGGAMSVLTNMSSYIRAFGAMEEAKLSGMMSELEKAIEAGTFMFVLPQFLVTGVK